LGDVAEIGSVVVVAVLEGQVDQVEEYVSKNNGQN
jgi:hypothetical protein